MRAQEFIVERDEWVHMDPPEVARWREQARVQGITSGPESTFSHTQPNVRGPRYYVPDAPWASAYPNFDAEKPKTTTGRRYTPPDERDEYWAASPQRKGGKVPVIKRDTHTRDVEMDADASKGKDWFDPKEQKAKKHNLTVNPWIPSIEKEKNRT
jgi:hypothetical protein